MAGIRFTGTETVTIYGCSFYDGDENDLPLDVLLLMEATGQPARIIRHRWQWLIYRRLRRWFGGEG